jgi:hypothetical protein
MSQIFKFNKLDKAKEYQSNNDLPNYTIVANHKRYFNKHKNIEELCYEFILLPLSIYKNFIKRDNYVIECDFIDFNFKNKIKNGNLFEILDKVYRKLYFDIDKISQDINTTINNFLNILKKHIDYGLEQPLILKRQNTNSLHLIFHNIKMDYRQQKQLSLFLHSELECIDTSIYNKSRFFCLPYNSKSYIDTKEPNNFICYDDYTNQKYNENIDNFLINDVSNCSIDLKFNNKFINETNKQVIEDNCKIVNTDNDKLVSSLIKNLPKEFYDNSYYWKLLIHYLYNWGYDFIKFMVHSAKIKDINYDDEIIYDYINKKIKNFYENSNVIFSLISKKYKLKFDFNNRYSFDFVKWVSDIIDIDTNTIIKRFDDYFDKANERNRENNKKNKPKTELVFNQYKIIIKSQIILDNENGKFYYYPISKINYKSKYEDNSIKIKIKDLKVMIEDDYYLNCFNKVNGVYALYGSGKSFYIVMELMRKYNKKILMITENNSINNESLIKYKEFGAKNHIQYRDGEISLKELQEARVAICSLESLEKLYNDYDIIVLDEFETLFNHFNSETLTNKKTGSNDYSIFLNLKNKCINADKIFCLDADLSIERTELLCNMVSSYEPKLFFCDDNNFTDTKHNIYIKRTEFQSKLLDDIGNDKKISLCANSKKECEVYKDLIDKKYTKTILLLTGSVDVKIFNYQNNTIILKKTDVLKDLENTIKNYQVDIFIYSPTIITGISINDDYFDSVFAIATNKYVCNSRIFLQMLYRNRRTKANEINISFNCSFNKYADNVNIKVLKFNQRCLLKEKYKLINISNDNVDEDFFNLRLINNTENLFSEKYFTQDTITRLKQHHFNINLIYNNKTDDKLNQLYQDIQSYLKAENIKKLINSDLIDDYDKTIIEQKDNKTDDDMLKLTKYYLFKLSGVYQRHKLFFNDKTDTNRLNFIDDESYYELLINNEYLIKFYKINIDNWINQNSQDNQFKRYEIEYKHIKNNDTLYLQYKKLFELLEFFGCKNLLFKISNKDFKKFILDNKQYILDNFNEYQSILIERKDIDYSIEVQNDILFKNVISLLKKLNIFGINCGYLYTSKLKLVSSSDKSDNDKCIYPSLYYKNIFKPNTKLSNDSDYFYIVSSITHLFMFNNFYYNYYIDFKKVFLKNKNNDYNTIIHNGIIQKDKNKITIKDTDRMVIDNKRIYLNKLKDTGELLYPNSINLYDTSINKTGTIKSRLVEIDKKDVLYDCENVKVKINIVNGEVKVNIFFPKRYKNEIIDTSEYNAEPKKYDTLEYFTNKKPKKEPLIYDTTEHFLDKIKVLSVLNKPYIKQDNIYRHFYKDYFVLAKHYNSVKNDFDNKYIDGDMILNNSFDLVLNEDKLTINKSNITNFIPIKLFINRDTNNYFILYKNCLLNDNVINRLDTKDIKYYVDMLINNPNYTE